MTSLQNFIAWDLLSVNSYSLDNNDKCLQVKLLLSKVQ